MGIRSVHPSYPEYKKAAEFCEVFHEGEWAVKAQGEKLLPRLSEQTTDKYNAYKDRAIVFGVVPRTVTALIATAFKKAPVFVLPEKLQYLLNDCTNTGVPLQNFVMRTLQELLVTGRAGILVDMPEVGGNPFFVLYDGDDILNWYEDDIEPFVVLENDRLVRKPDDKFAFDEKSGWRELAINENGEYVVNLWELDDRDEEFIAETIQPLRAGKPLREIPFAPISAFGVEFEPSLPPILPLAQLSQKAYLVSADRMLACHVISIPTPYVAFDGLDTDTFGDLKLGPDAGILLPSGTAKCGFLEFTGQGLGAVEKVESDIRDMMGALGARLLMGQESSSEKATGVRVREEIANSVLTSVLTSLEAAINKVLKLAAYWLSVNPDEVYCKLNKELISTNIDANTLNALFTAYQNGSIDLKTLFHNLSEGSYVPPDTDLETFKEGLSDKESVEAAQDLDSQRPGVDNSQNM